MHIIQLLLGSVLAFALGALAASASDWRSRSIYQVLTDRFAQTSGSTTAPCKTADRVYCGGTWNGIIHQLDYIQQMGFDAIWISPVTSQISTTPYGDAYHGYWQNDVFQLNQNFGNAADLKALSAALHSRGMYLMVDIVVNHFGWSGSPDTVNYQQLTPFAAQSHFHPYCQINYTKTADMQQMQTCWMGDQVVSLPDLRTEDTDVINTWSYWIASMVATYSIDGLRLDSAMEVDTGFWPTFLSAAGVYAVGEVFNYDAAFVCSYQSNIPGVLNYPTYSPLIDAFRNSSGNISALVTAVNAVKGACHDPSLLGSFSENHDVPRFASLTGDLSLAQTVVTFTMLSDGIPIIYEGQEQHYNALGGSNDPYNREAIWFSNYDQQAPLYQVIKKLNAARKNAMIQDAGYLGYKNYPFYWDDHTVALRKGDMVTILTNGGVDSSWYTLQLASGYQPGTQVTELLTCTQQTVDAAGNLAVPMAGGLPRVYYPTWTIGYQCGQSSKLKSRQGDIAVAFEA